MKAHLLLAVVVAVVAVVTTPDRADAADRVVERGIIQSLGPTEVSLRALDGTTVVVPLGPETRFRLNGRLASLGAIRPGLVAEAVSFGGGPARALRAFGPAKARVQRGVLERLTRSWLVIRRLNGSTRRIPVTNRTIVRLDGIRVRPRRLRVGLHLEVRLNADGEARTIVVRRGAA